MSVKNNFRIALRLFVAVLLANVFVLNSHAQEMVAAADSQLVGVRLPANAARLTEGNIPSEVDQALKKMVASGSDKIRQGDREVLAWTTNFKKSNAANLIGQLKTELQTAGWTFEIGGENEGVTIFSVYRAAPQKRAVIGFYTASDDALVLAWTEMLRADAPSTVNISTRPANNSQTDAPQTTGDAGAAIVLNVEKNSNYVNVMSGKMPAMPQFSPLTAKPGRVRGYVKDWTGKPLAGAEIGVRGTYLAGSYSGAQGKTDANGYYEFAIPTGVSHYYNAGYQIEWGDGVAALGLHPADGNLDSFASTDGAVENFVLLPYGVASRENLQENPHLASTYYGGSIYLGCAAIEDSMLEITLTPEDAGGKSFVIRKSVGMQVGFYINNIPVGRYRIKVTEGGRPLKLKDYKKSSPLFGLTPSEAIGTGEVLFEPNDAKASMVVPQAGGWKSVEIYVSRQ